MVNGAYGATRERDMSKSGSYCVITIPFAGDGLERVDVSGNLTFGDIEVNVGPRAKMLGYAHEGYHILYGVCDECVIITVPFTDQLKATRGNIVALVCGHEPADERFDHEVKKKGGQRVTLEGSPPDPHGWGASVVG